MTATEILRREHEAVLKMLDATEQVAEQIENGVKVRPEVFNDLLEFFQIFTDKCHHTKEEELLFPALLRKGIPSEGGPVSVMLHEHEEGRALIREMAESGRAYQSDAEGAGRRWTKAARAYAKLLREHISKENNVLFVLAERVLTQGELEQLAVSFEKVEIERLGVGTHERLHAKMNHLLAELATPAKV